MNWIAYIREMKTEVTQGVKARLRVFNLIKVEKIYEDY